MTSEFAIGVHVLVYLNRKKETISSEQLAQNVCTNPARIRKVMAKLKRGGLMETKEGTGGGFRIAKPVNEITLQDVCVALGEESVKMSWQSGNLNKNCMVASGMEGIMEDLYIGLNDLCRSYLDNITVADIEYKIMEGERI